ncbi:hypothetical protein KEM48_012608 [Puccinia striiformis f. sp. tritici PST-130]|nr:hypothetical protein KEM48_012608 [Puccinia striiformis f. sp. tritici PST-130]
MADVSPPVEMVKIQNEDRDLGFDGTNVEEFLHWYQKAAKEDGASEDDMAQQLGCFVLSDDLLNIVENMEGYEPPNWPKLKASMVAYWGRAKIPRFTLKDLERLLLSWSEKDDISPARDYPNFCDSLEPIVSHLLENNDISTEKLQNILYQAFSRVPQCSLHRSTSALKLNEILSRPEIDYRATINISSLLESPSTVFRDVMATPSVPNLDKGTLDAEPEPLKQSIEDPGEAAVSLLPPIPSPIQPSLFQSEVCLENDVKNNHIDVLDNSLCEISNVIVSDVVVSETLEEFDISVSNPFLGLCSCPLGLLRCPIHDNQLVEVTEVGERILSLDPLKRQIKKPVSDSQAKINLKVWEEPSGLGEDHNHFIDRFDPIDFNFNIDSPIFDITSTHNQEPKHFLDSVMSLIPNSDRQKASNPAKITKEISAPLGHHRLGPLSLNSATLRKENKSPIFHSKEEDVLFPEYSSMLHLKKDQDTLLQDFLQKPLRDENKLPSFHSKEEVLLQEPALLFQDLPQDPLRDKNTQLSFHLKNTNSFPEPVSPVWDQLRNEDKLSCVEFGQKEEAKWRNWGTKENNRSRIKLCRFRIVSVTRINYLQSILKKLSSYDEFDQSHCARCWNEAPKTAIFLRFLGSQQSSASSSLPLHVFPLLSSYSLIASDITSRFELENDLTNNNINDRTTAPHSHNAPSLATDLIGFRSAFITPASELTKGDINIKPQSAIFSTQYLPSQEQSKMIRNLSRASNSHELLYLNDFLDYCLYSLSQAYYSASFASNSSVPTSEAHCGLSWNRSGIGPDHVFPSEDCLRNEDKLPSFCLNSRGPFPAEALLTKSFLVRRVINY